MITNKQLVAYAKSMLGHPYWYGCFGQVSSKSLYASKKKQYPVQYQWACPASQLNTRVFDCIGLIKGAMWTDADPNKAPHYVKSQDVSANGMLEKCKLKGSISTIPEVKGILVFLKGHVGVYIGGGEVIEARGHAWGVVKTKLKDRPWTHWGYNPWIEYVAEQPKAPKIKNGVYTLTNVRGVYNGWGSETNRKRVKDLTSDGKKNAVCTKNNAEAFLKAGTAVSVSETKLLKSGNLWAKIPSGYICIWEHKNNKTFIE